MLILNLEDYDHLNGNQLVIKWLSTHKIIYACAKEKDQILFGSHRFNKNQKLNGIDTIIFVIH